MPISRTEDLPYRVGGLLYMPAFQKNIVPKIAQGSIPCLTSIAFCLEDAIRTSALAAAEQSLHAILRDLQTLAVQGTTLPLLFVRVRTPEHFAHVLETFADVRAVLTGFVLPKFDLDNAAAYLAIVQQECAAGRQVFIMPTLETRMIAACDTRPAVLRKLHELLAPVQDAVLNIRVGGNDFSHLYGLRRPVTATIYDVGIVRDILLAILNVFAADYVVSGPVWNYFGARDAGDAAWMEGLRRELACDRLHGFIGKTAIHPCQLPLIYDSLSVSREDYDDACRLLQVATDETQGLGVEKSAGGHRMNEVTCHSRWAKRMLTLAAIYGIREEGRA